MEPDGMGKHRLDRLRRAARGEHKSNGTFAWSQLRELELKQKPGIRDNLRELVSLAWAPVLVSIVAIIILFLVGWYFAVEMGR